MPELNNITDVTYQPEWPYHYDYDNIPLRNILRRIDIINYSVDRYSTMVRGAIGSTQSLAERLDKSLEQDGSLKVESVDSVMHNIGAHEDGEISGIIYVRMTADERDKLSLIQPEATRLEMEVESISTIEPLLYPIASLQHSDTITFSLEYPNIIKAHTVFPSDAAHQHHYHQVPYGGTIPNYKDYQTTTLSTPYVEGTLRVFVNGIYLGTSVDEAVYIYDNSEGPVGFWTLTYLDTVDPESGTFSLNRTLDPSDIITIEFDTDFS
jgi:hypothetical protein